MIILVNYSELYYLDRITTTRAVDFLRISVGFYVLKMSIVFVDADEMEIKCYFLALEHQNG